MEGEERRRAELRMKRVIRNLSELFLFANVEGDATGLNFENAGGVSCQG